MGASADWICPGCNRRTEHRARGLCRKCYMDGYRKRRELQEPGWKARFDHDHYMRHRDRLIARYSEANKKLKWEVIGKLGGVCSCCGENALEFLSVHHVNGDGGKHRGKTGQLGIYRDVKNAGFPRDRYEVLCFNCNCSIGFWGYCPHKHKRTGKFPQQMKGIHRGFRERMSS